MGTMKPLNNYITIELVDEPTKLILTDKPMSPKGKVVGIGTKVKEDIKIGDIIYYNARSGHEYKGQQFIKVDQILAVEV